MDEIDYITCENIINPNTETTCVKAKIIDFLQPYANNGQLDQI